MTDRYKGFLITLDKEIRNDNAEHIVNALKMIKGVYSVKPYISGMEDGMYYQKGLQDIGQKLMEFAGKECFGLEKYRVKE